MVMCPEASRALQDAFGSRALADRLKKPFRRSAFTAEEDLNRLMVLDGQAVAYRQFSPRYVREENAARAARRGIWGTEFDVPWDWRRGN